MAAAAQNYCQKTKQQKAGACVDTEGCHALSAKHLSGPEQDDLLFPFTLPAVALPPKVTSIPVRFNRVCSEDTLGVLSVVYSTLFYVFCLGSLKA